MNENVLQSFQAAYEAMQTEPCDWQWIGPHVSQRFFSITQARAEAYAAKYGGTAYHMQTDGESNGS